MAQPHMCTVNLDSGTVTKACMVPMPLKEGLDFPQLRRSLVGRRNRFGYFSGFDRHGKSRSLVKMDLQASEIRYEGGVTPSACAQIVLVRLA